MHKNYCKESLMGILLEEEKDHLSFTSQAQKGCLAIL